MTGPERDESLVRRYLEGDVAAFSVLVERHQGRVYNLCLRIVGRPEDAADATQEAFLAALRKLGQFRGESAFTTWLHRVTVNACYDLLRKERRQPMLRLVDDERDEPPELGPPLADHADAVAGGIDVAEALRKVPDEFRVALVLADVEDLPYEQIARILDVPVGTVKSRVHRGRVALGKALGHPSAGPRASREPMRPSQTSEEQA